MTLTPTQWQAYVRPSPSKKENSFVLVHQASQSDLNIWSDCYCCRVFIAFPTSPKTWMQPTECTRWKQQQQFEFRGSTNCFWFRNLHRKSVSDHLHQLQRDRRRTETHRLTFVCVTCTSAAACIARGTLAAHFRRSTSSTVPIFAIQRALTPHTNARFIGYFESFFFLSVNWRA